MGRMPSENRKYQLRQLNEMHHEIIRLSLIGLKPKQIAMMLGITEATVCNATQSAKGRQSLAILRAVRDSDSIDIAKDIVEFAPRCVEVLQEIVDDPNNPAAVRGKFAVELLGIAGHVKPQRVQVQGTMTHLSIDEISAIKARARKLASESGVIDAEYVEQTQGELTESPTSHLESENEEERAKLQKRE